MHALDLSPFWIRFAAGLLAGAATWIVAIDYGVAIISRWLRFSSPVARLAVGGAAGYALLGSAVAVLGFTHAIHPIALWPLLGIAILAAAPRHLRRLQRLHEGAAIIRRLLAPADIVNRLALAVISIAVISALVNAALPAVWWDPIAYHLPLVVTALAHGSFTFDPRMVQSGFPLLGEAAALPAYALAGSAGAAMATLGAGICVLALVWVIAEEIVAGSGLLAAMLAASSALWAWLAPSFYVDVPFAMFGLAAIVVVMLVRAAEASEHSGFAAGALAGALCGAAAATKYSGLGVALIVVGFAIWVASAGRAKLLAGFCGGFALIAGGWYLRSLLLAGDPLYPFLSPSLATSPLVRDFASRYVDMTRHWCGGTMTLSDLAALPYRFVADARRFCGDPGVALQLGLVFAVAALLLVRRARIVGTLVLALTLLWFGSSQQWRFLLVPLFLYATLIAAGARAIGERLRLIAGVTLAVLAALVVAANWSARTMSLASASLVPAFAYIAGTESAAQYLDNRLESFAAARWLAEHRISGDRVIALDDVRDYYFPPGIAWANPYYQEALAIDWRQSSRRRYAPLVARGVTYLVVNENEAYLHRTPTGVDWNAFATDKRNGLRQLFSANGVSVYDVSSVR